MSKQSEAKEKQNYQAKPLAKRCRECDEFTSEVVENRYGYPEEKNMRCSVGGFKVTPNGVCDLFIKKVSE